MIGYLWALWTLPLWGPLAMLELDRRRLVDATEDRERQEARRRQQQAERAEQREWVQ